MSRKFVMAVLFAAVLTAAASAARLPGALSGVVADSSGAPIPSAQVLLSGPDAKERETTADPSGQFMFADLAAGSYLLTAKAQGFQDAVMTVQVGAEPVAKKIKMTIAMATEEMTVTASTVDPVAADANLSGIEVQQDLLKSLPVKDGDPVATAALFVDPAANGVEGTKIVVDGVETSSLDTPASGVKSVAVNRNPYSAEFGRPGKGRIEVSSRAGSAHHMHLHTVATIRNSRLDARNAFAAEKPDMSRQLYESWLDGPLPRERGTFYLGGDYLRDNQNAIVHADTANGLLIQNVPAPQRALRVLGRVDFRLTPINTLSFRYNFNRSSAENQGVGGFDLPQRAFNAHTHVNEARIFDIATPSAGFINEFRFTFRNKVTDQFGVDSSPAFIVPGSSHSGGAQVADRNRERVLDFEEIAGVIKGRNTWRLGGAVRRRSFDIFDASNFGGTYTLSAPGWFAVNVGNPRLDFTTVDYYYFVQDDVRLRKNLDLVAGFRHELQSNLGYHRNIAPRLGLSYAPGKGTTVVRAGAGVFYERLPWTMQEQALLYDGAAHVSQVLVQNPVVPQPLPGVLQPSIVQIARGSRTPYLVQSSLALEQRLGAKNFLSVEYTFLRGIHLYRTRDVNAPLPATGVRPEAAFTNIDRFEAAGDSRAHSLSVGFRSSLRKRLEILSQYTFSRSTDNTSGMSWHPANNYDLTGEYGRSDFDRRHRLSLATIFYLPWDLKFGTVTQLSSGIPYNITTGLDNNHDTVFNDRPLGVSRNTGKGPGFATVDLRLSRRFRFYSEPRAPYLELRFDAFNVMNSVNATNFVGVQTSSFFGRANAAGPARQLQISARLGF